MAAHGLLQTIDRIRLRVGRRLATVLPGTPSGPSILNEAINFERKAIFIAIPKTGTTSVRRQLRTGGIPLVPQPHLDILQIRDSIYVHLLRQASGRNRSFPSEGVPTDAELRAEARSIFESFFKFAAVRNPWARAVSLYQRREGIRPGRSMGFPDFCERHLFASDTSVHPTLHRNQCDWLCDESGRIVMDYVYKVEEFGTAVREIEERTGGRLRLELRSENVNPASRAARYRDLYDDRTRTLIASRFERDIDTFRYAF